MPDQISMFDDNPAYQAFIDKFKPKKTTDDCYTPPVVYRAVAEWACRRYGIAPERIIRPFYPGGDFENHPYPPGCVVLDNPPFSLYARIIKFYVRAGIDFFLFAPTLTLFSPNLDVCYIPIGVQVTYDNGAQVNTSFVTSLDPALVRGEPDLYRAVKAANDENVRARTKELPKYTYPPEVLTAANAYIICRHIHLTVQRHEAAFIRRLDAQKAADKSSGIFGGAFLLSERAAAERAAAERAAAERAAATRWQLSPRERALQSRLSAADQIPVGALSERPPITATIPPTTATIPPAAATPWLFFFPEKEAIPCPNTPDA